MAISTEPTGYGLRLTAVQDRPILAQEESEWNGLMGSLHLLGTARFAGHRIKYVAEHRGRAVALVCFSACAYHVADRDRWLGWSDEQATQRRQFVVQNSRFLILPGESHRNLASRVLSLCTRRLAEDWRQRFGYAPVLVETFVDPVHFRGTSYEAAGWIHVGSTRGFRRDGREFYSPDSSPKMLWLKPLRADARELLSGPVLPDEMRAFEKPLPGKRVAARLKLTGLRSLFTALHEIRDPRGSQGKRYALGCCLSLVACAVLAGCKGLRECGTFAAALTQPQLEALRCWKSPRTGRYVAPKYNTLWRTVSGIDPAEFERTVSQWFRDEQLSPEAVAIDGKTLRATLLNEEGESCAVSAVSHCGTPLFSTRSSLTPKAKKSQQHRS